MIMEVILTAILGIITTAVGSGTTWVLARKKYNAEVEGTTIENLQESLEFYKKLSDDNRDRLEEILKRDQAIIEKDVDLSDQMLKLTAENRGLKQEIKELKQEVSELKHIIQSFDGKRTTKKKVQKK